MAIVPDLSGNFPASLPTGIDPEVSSINRIVAAAPNGSLLPLFVGERVRDNVTGLMYISEGLTITDWVLFNRSQRI